MSALRGCGLCVTTIFQKEIGNSGATKPFRDGVGFLSIEAYGEVVTRLHMATKIYPHFAAVYNQCAIVHFF